MLDDERWVRHRRGSGLLLLLFLTLALGWPLWHWRGHDHPLANVATVDLCTRLAGVPDLARLTAKVQPAPGSAGACQWRDAQDHAQLDAILATTRSAAGPGPGATNLARSYETWRDETRKSGVEDATEQERDGIRSFRYRRGPIREWLLDDHGIMLWLRSDTLDAAALDALGKRIGLALRTTPE